MTSSAIPNKYVKKLEDWIYMIHLLSELLDLDFCATATFLQYLLETF